MIERAVLRKEFPFFLLILFLCTVSFVRSQSLQFDNYALNKGLSQNTVVCLLQDKNGFIWIGTQDGLNRFDGYEFKVYKKEKKDFPATLGGNFIWDLIEGPDGRIWIAHDGGISCYDSHSDSFYSYPVEGGSTTIRSLFLNDNVLWLGTSGQGLFRFDLQTTSLKSVINDVRTNIPFNNILDISAAQNGNLIVGTRGGGLFLYNENVGFYRPPQDIEADSRYLVENDIWNIRFYKGHYWLATRKGLVKTDSLLRLIKSYPLNQDELNPNRISSLLFDGNHHAWIAAYGSGLIHFDIHTEEFKTYRHSNGDPNSLAHDLAFSLMFDRSGNLWVGSWLGGLSKLKGNYTNFSGYSSAAIDDPNHFVTTVAFARMKGKEILLTGCYGGGVRMSLIHETTDLNFGTLAGLNAEALGKLSFVNFLYAGKERLWVGTDDNGVVGISNSRVDNSVSSDMRVLFSRHGSKSPLYNPVKSIAEDQLGSLWIGTIGGGAVKIDANAKSLDDPSFRNFVYDEADSSSISHNRVNHILVDKTNRVWLSTSNGLNLYENGKFRRFLTGKVITSLQHSSGSLFVGTEEGLFVTDPTQFVFFKKVDLPDNYLVNAIQEDTAGSLWLSTNNGIFKFNINEQTLDWFRSSDGLMDDEYNYNASAASKNGIMCFGGVNGLTVFRPSNIKLNKHTPQVAFTRLKIFNSEVTFSKNRTTSYSLPSPLIFLPKIELQYNQNSIAFEFTALDFTNPTKNQYAYKLAGFDESWVSTNSMNRTATYTNLNPGRYQLFVKASNNDGHWNNTGTSIEVFIAPPPWLTWWAYCGYAFVMVCLLFLARRVIVNRERLKALVAIEQAEKSALKELDHLRLKFFSNITHEFRTPLTLIQGPVNELLAKENNRDSKFLLQLVQTNSNRLLKLINQLLDLAKLDAHEMKLALTSTDLKNLITVVTSQFSSLAQSRNINLLLDVNGQLPTVEADDNKLETILNNLISNAIKFTPPNGNVIVFIKFAENRLRLRVTDTGKGIPKEKLKHIFDRFYQVDPSDSTHVEGTGIGLALVAEYTKLMNGIILVESEVDRGTVFSLELPMLPIQSISTEESKWQDAIKLDAAFDSISQESQPDLPLVLLVEDNADIRKFLMLCLGDRYRFAEADDGKKGLQMAFAQVPDLIISDWMMPEMDGAAFCKQIKNDPRTDHIPFIMLTAKADDKDKLAVLKYGATDFLVKPFVKEELVAKVRNLSDQKRKLQDLLKRSLLTEVSLITASSAAEVFVAEAKAYVERNIASEDLSVETLASALTLSREQCYRKMLALTGLPPSTFIRKLRLQRAKQLLSAKVNTVSQVAYNTGFNNLSYFSKAFKEEFGVLPSDI